MTPNKMRRLESDANTMATLTILTSDDQMPTTTVLTNSPIIVTSNSCLEHSMDAPVSELQLDLTNKQPHRSRKQRHEHLLTMPIDEEDPLQLNSSDCMDIVAENCYGDSTEAATRTIASVASVTPAASALTSTPIPIVKKRGRPKKLQLNSDTIKTAQDELSATASDKAAKPRLSRVQLLRKRLAIDMVDSEQPPLGSGELENADLMEDIGDAAIKRERALRTPLRTSRRSVTPNVVGEKSKQRLSLESTSTSKKNKRVASAASASEINAIIQHQSTTTFNHFGGSNSSISSACSSSSVNSATVTTTAVATVPYSAMTAAAQIDLTMSSSCSSISNGSTTATVTTAQARGNSMLPPTTILSSSDPMPDVVFKVNDFSCIMSHKVKVSRPELQAGDATAGDRAENSGDNFTASPGSAFTTPVRGRGRGRGSRGGRGSGSGRGTRGHRLGRGASAVAKAIASSRPRCVGGLKHTPDPERLKGLFTTYPQVFEEDTRMSADLSQIQIQPTDPQTPVKQPEFFTNEESQSSVVSNNSILDPNNISAMQNGSSSSSVVKRPKKKKMEVCVAEDTDFTVTSIAEYDWPPPKGCCPSKNRDTFMIQEQVALYLGIKSFKRKYPDLPRRQIDMEERNWLQEKGLVNEKMCDLGITAVWASDILDIMYTDFYDKYEEYKDFIRQKHLREIEAKQKALGLNVNGRGLQARDRAMLSASKWNVYFNKSRKEERPTCLDLQTLTINVPSPANAPSATFVDRPIAEAVARAAKLTCIPEPPTLLKPRLCERPLRPEIGYPLALVPGQFAENYRQYTPLELRSLPLNTVLDDPLTLKERLRQAQQEQSSSESDVEANMQSTNTVDELTAKAATKTAIRASCPDGKRVPVRRSRRARMKAAAKSKCDIARAVVRDGNVDKKPALLQASSYSSTDEDSSTEESSSGTNSETESCSSYSSSSSTESEGETIPATCGVCQNSQHRNLKALPEVFIKCYTCRRKVHPSCIEMPHRMVARVRNYNWQCAECKCCIKCKRKQDANKMLYCEQCDRGFHIYCLDVKAVPDGRWSCERCSVCMRCGATKPEGLPPPQQPCLISPTGEKIKQIKHKKVKWINEYRIDHITKLREHCSMLCVPCGRMKTAKRVQIMNSLCNSSHSGNGNSGIALATTTVHAQATKVQVTQATQKQHGQQQQVPAAVASQVHFHPPQHLHVRHQQQHQLSQIASTAARTTTNMSPPAAPSPTITNTSKSNNKSAVAATTLPPPPVVA